MFCLEDFPELNNLEPEKKPVIVTGDSDKLAVALEELNRLTGLEEVKKKMWQGL